jgi:hypothetical protein
MALKPSMSERRAPADVFDTLLEEADSKVERAVVQLVMETLAFYERGAIVETSEGWRGVVVQPGERMSNFPRPVVRMVRDGNNNAIEPQDLDLSDPDIDFKRFGLVRRQLRNVKDERLLEVARQLRPDDWKSKHTTPSSKSRERSKPRSTASKSKQKTNKSKQKKRKPKKKKKKKQAPTPEQSSPNTGAGDNSSAPGAGAIGSSPRDDSRPGAGTSQSIETRRRESNDDSSSDDASVVLEFGPGSGPGGGSSPSPTQQPESPSQQSGGNPQPQQTGSDAASRQTADESADEGVQELTPEAIEPTETSDGDDESSEDGPIALDPEQVDPVDDEPAEPEPDRQTQSPVAAQEATQQMSREEADDKLGDFVDREQERAEQEDDGDGMLRDYVDSVRDDQNVGGEESGARDPQQFAPSELSGETEANAAPAADEEEFADMADAAPDDATRQMDSDQSARVLEDFVEETADAEPAAGDDATQQVDAEKSHQMLQDYVDEPDDEQDPSPNAQEDDDGRLGELATNMSENTSPEEVSKTERVSSEKSHELLRDFVEENSGPEDGVQADGGEPASPDSQGSGATEAISSEKSKELLDSFVDEPSDQGEPHDSGLEDDDRLDQLASDIDDGPPGDDDTAKTVANDKSHELMRDFVEETPGSEQESPDEGRGDDQLGELVDEAEQMDDDSSGESGATEAISSEKSRELLKDFVDSEQEAAEQGEDNATRQVDAEHSAEILQDFVDEEEDS